MANSDNLSDSDNSLYLDIVSAPSQPHLANERALAEIGSIKANTRSRLFMVVVIASIFIGLNWAVMSFVKDAFLNDVAQIAANPPLIKPEDRLITTEVVMSLIGATVVQVGVAVIAIVSYLFPKQA